MSADVSADSAAPPNLNLSPEEKRVYGQLFRQADTENVGVVTGDVAVKFFEKTRLDSRVLGEIWQIADGENRGFLTPAGFGLVLRLIGHAQSGREPTREIALQQGPIPRFDGLWPTSQQPPASSMGSPSIGSPAPSLQAQASGGAIRIPPLTPDKVAQFTSLFERQPLQANQLPGEQARNIFDKSGLPNETLGRIWALADTEQRGALVLPEFVIAMHLLTSLKTGALRSLPNVLPAGLYEAAASRGSAATRISPNHTGMSALPRQLTGQAGMRTGSPLGRPPASAPAPAPAPASSLPGTGDWAVSPADKAKFDQIYATIDKTNKGYITGEEAVPFFSQSNLSEDVLAQIWDLADFNGQGQLTREGFSIAMFLIRQQRSGSGGPLPSTLPPNLVPPSVRNQRQVPPPFSPSIAARSSPIPAPKSALDDLFGLDSSSVPAAAPAPAPAPAQTTMSTGGSVANDPFSGGAGVSAVPSSPLRSTATGSSFRPFVPSSTFGRGLAGPSGVDSPKPSEDLLEDNDPEASKKISGETTELANLSSQIGTLSKQMQDVQNKRNTTQNELNQTNSQKQNFEQRLAQLRALYEKEADDTRSLEQQLRKSRTDTQKLQSDCMALEGTYRDVQAQHQQLVAALQADQQENTALRERIRAVNGQIAQLKAQIERLKSEARQQKGLVAINKKQLATTEGERDRLNAEAQDLARSGGEEASRQMEGSSPAAGAGQIVSPTLSTASGNNPFFKRTASTDIMGAFPSQSARSYNDKSFDDVFGPSSSDQNATPPPTVPAPAFQQLPPEASVAAAVGSFPETSNASPTVSRQGTMTLELPAPPPPPVSRQMSSSILPFHDKPESLSSSRQVSPPASRAGGAPPTAASSRGSSIDEDEDDYKTPGDTPLASDAPAVAAVSVNEAASKARDEAPPATTVQEDDPFGTADQAKAKADFNDAFATFAASGKSQPSGNSDAAATATATAPATAPADAAVAVAAANKKSADAFNNEFPPISELERDDESDSDSEGGGFDDDFAPTSPPPPPPPPAKDVEKKSSDVTAVDEPDNAAPAVPAKEPIEAAKKSSDPPSSPATVTNTSQPAMTADDIFGVSPPRPAATAATAYVGVVPAPAPAPAPTHTVGKGIFDELDDDFEGLEDAKEGSADDDFANISRDDFNPVFDHSPPASQAKTGSTTQQKTTADSHDWDAIFAGLDEPTHVTPPGVGESNGGSDKKGYRPQPPGRALTEQGLHDDPILKSLTSMGYSRSDAVAALEKYDYNLEQAANYLASKS